MNNSSAQLHLQRMVHRRSQFPQAVQKWTAAGSFQSDVPGSSSVFQGCWCAAYLAMWSKVLILLSCLHVTSHVAHSIVPSQALFQAGLFFQLCLQTEAASRKRTENVKMEMRKTVASAQLKKCHGSENVDEGEALGAAAGCHFSNFYLETLQLSFSLLCPSLLLCCDLLPLVTHTCRGETCFSPMDWTCDHSQWHPLCL